MVTTNVVLLISMSIQLNTKGFWSNMYLFKNPKTSFVCFDFEGSNVANNICSSWTKAYLSQVNGISCSLILPPLISRILFRCLIFNCYNISICKKEKLKDEASKKICETNGRKWDLHRFHKFSLDVSSLIVTTSAFAKKKGQRLDIQKKL